MHKLTYLKINLIYVPKFTKKNIKNEEKKAQIKFNSAGGPIFIWKIYRTLWTFINKKK